MMETKVYQEKDKYQQGNFLTTNNSKRNNETWWIWKDKKTFGKLQHQHIIDVGQTSVNTHLISKFEKHFFRLCCQFLNL